MFGVGSSEVFVILLVALLVFGAKRIPEMAQGLGKGIREFRKAMHEVQDEIDVQQPPPRPAPRTQIAPPAPWQAIPQQTAPPPPQAAATGTSTEDASSNPYRLD